MKYGDISFPRRCGGSGEHSEPMGVPVTQTKIFRHKG